mgnify:CR=1 FL=1
MSLNEDALEYHAKGRPGKVKVVPTKDCITAEDLSLAYSPGVAAPCLAIDAYTTQRSRTSPTKPPRRDPNTTPSSDSRQLALSFPS